MDRFILISGVWAALNALSLAACSPRASELSDRAVLTMPTKDDVALMNGRPLTLTVFRELRGSWPEASLESALWVSLGAMALQDAARSRGLTLSTGSALSIARYASGVPMSAEAEIPLRRYYGTLGKLPGSGHVHHEISSLLARSVIVRNPQAIAEIRDTK